MLNHGHFPHDFDGFRPEPPDQDAEPIYAARFGVEGYNLVEQQVAHEFYQQWTAEGEDALPRFLVVEVQHACPCE